MSEEDCNKICDTTQKEELYQLPDEPEENEGAIYDDVHQDLDSESNLYASNLETYEYDSFSAGVVGGEENNLTSSQPEYDLLYEISPEEPQYLQPGELQKDEGIISEELYSTPDDQELDSEDPQENGSRMKEDPLSVSCFSMQESNAFSTVSDSSACYSAADDLGENDSSSVNPEINLYVKPFTIQDSGDSMSSLEKP